jgi:tetratricopeptide (TPR) repeat protein
MRYTPTITDSAMSRKIVIRRRPSMTLTLLTVLLVTCGVLWTGMALRSYAANGGIASTSVMPTAGVRDADYWVDRAGLCATYGNDKAAVRLYQKAVDLDPEKSEAYFGMGLAYGSLGEFDKALEAVNMSISLNSQKALYYYGRGRIYLLSGQKDQAMEDIRIAAEKGNLDARRYLGMKIDGP